MEQKLRSDPKINFTLTSRKQRPDFPASDLEGDSVASKASTCCSLTGSDSNVTDKRDYMSILFVSSESVCTCFLLQYGCCCDTMLHLSPYTRQQITTFVFCEGFRGGWGGGFCRAAGGKSWLHFGRHVYHCHLDPRFICRKHYI